MQTDTIKAVGIDEQGSLWVRPAIASFPYIYREAMGVHWDTEHLRLYSPKPTDWPYVAWFKRIRDAARAQGFELKLEQTTSWSGIDPELQRAIVASD